MQETRIEAALRPQESNAFGRKALNASSDAIQFVFGLLTPMLGVALIRRLIRARAEEPDRVGAGRRFVFSLIVAVLGIAFLMAFSVAGMAVLSVVMGIPLSALLNPPPAPEQPTGPLPPAVLKFIMTMMFVRIGWEFATGVLGFIVVGVQGTDTRRELLAYGNAIRFRFTIVKAALSLFLLMFSLLPLSALLLAYPAAAPQETILSDSVSSRRSWWRGLLGRVAAVALGLTMLLGLLAVSVEIVTRLPLPEKGSFGVIPKTLLPKPSSVLPFLPGGDEPLYMRLPTAMVEHWPFVFLLVYLLDLGVLVMVGNVPLAYNVRNLRVRWRTNLMTGLSFVAVISLLSFLLAFANGMNSMSQNTGIPGNVFVIADGSSDEIFSNLSYNGASVDNVERSLADELQLKDAAGQPILADDGNAIWKPIRPLAIKQEKIDGKLKYLSSRETFYSINMPMPNSEKRRFVQLRAMYDIDVSAPVHNAKLFPGGRWFNKKGGDDQGRIECVIGDGIAGTLGDDLGLKRRMRVGDEFQLGDMPWVVVGVMDSEGSTYGSEIWTDHSERVKKAFGKSNFTTLVMRTEANTLEAARAYANWLNLKYTQQKLKASAEPDYFAELTRTNDTFLLFIVIICIVMAIGGIVGMMTTMFASIAQRIRDIGVLRLLGFKRWQVMVSFLLESLAIALIGGLVGVLVAWAFADGKESTSMMSAGGGGPGGKSVALKIRVSSEVAAMGILFSLVMGRLGGLIPALGATRMKILDSLR